MKRTGHPDMGCVDRKYKLNGKPTHHSQKECRDPAPLTANFTRHGDQPLDPLSTFAFAVAAVVAALDHPCREAQTRLMKKTELWRGF